MRRIAVLVATASVGMAVWVGASGTQAVQATLDRVASATQRSGNRSLTAWSARQWPSVSLPGVRLYVAPGVRRRDVSSVAAALQRAEPRVVEDFGLERHPVWPVMLVTRQILARQLHVAPTAVPLGYYQAGVVWLLDPRDFLPRTGGAALYWKRGPVVHELTHQADAIVSGGEVPRWFDEGLAQYEDWRLTGYVWTQPGDGFTRTTYTWGQLSDGFGALPNQALAYRQALAATAPICRVGAGACVHVLQQLAAGVGISVAIRSVGGAALLDRLRAGVLWVAGSGPSSSGLAGPAP